MVCLHVFFSPFSFPLLVLEYWDSAVFSVVVVAQWECENL